MESQEVEQEEVGIALAMHHYLLEVTRQEEEEEEVGIAVTMHPYLVPKNFHLASIVVEVTMHFGQPKRFLCKIEGTFDCLEKHLAIVLRTWYFVTYSKI